MATPKFTAKWGGTCPWCGEQITPGEEAGYDHDDRMVHYACSLLGER